MPEGAIILMEPAVFVSMGKANKASTSLNNVGKQLMVILIGWNYEREDRTVQ